jgi:hypothetical protein
MRPSRAARLRCCFPCDWALRRRLSRTDHALSPSAWMRVSTRPSRSRPQWTRKRRTHGAQSDARSRQRMQKCTPRGRRSRGSSISGVYRAPPHGNAATYPDPIGRDRIRHLPAPRPDTLGSLAAHSRRIAAGSTTGPRAREHATAPGHPTPSGTGRSAGISFPLVPTCARPSYGGARLIIVRSLVRIQAELLGVERNLAWSEALGGGGGSQQG